MLVGMLALKQQMTGVRLVMQQPPTKLIVMIYEHMSRFQVTVVMPLWGCA